MGTEYCIVVVLGTEYCIVVVLGTECCNVVVLGRLYCCSTGIGYLGMECCKLFDNVFIGTPSR